MLGVQMKQSNNAEKVLKNAIDRMGVQFFAGDERENVADLAEYLMSGVWTETFLLGQDCKNAAKEVLDSLQKALEKLNSRTNIRRGKKTLGNELVEFVIRPVFREGRPSPTTDQRLVALRKVFERGNLCFRLATEESAFGGRVTNERGEISLSTLAYGARIKWLRDSKNERKHPTYGKDASLAMLALMHDLRRKKDVRISRATAIDILSEFLTNVESLPTWAKKSKTVRKPESISKLIDRSIHGDEVASMAELLGFAREYISVAGGNK